MNDIACDRTRCVVPLDTHGEEFPLFLVHGADGGVEYARVIARHLQRNRPVFGVRMEGYVSSPPPPRSIEALARRYVKELKEMRPEGPYVVGGYSIGGVLALEMVRQLEEDGETVSLTVLIDSRFPSTKDDADATDGRRNVGVIPRPPRLRIQRLWRRHVSLPIKEMIVSGCVRFGWPLPRWWKIRTGYFWRMLVTARNAYRPQSVLAPILIFAADGTSRAHRSTWGPLSQQGCRIIEIAAGHLDLVCEPYVTELALHLKDALARSASGADHRR